LELDAFVRGIADPLAYQLQEIMMQKWLKVCVLTLSVVLLLTIPSVARADRSFCAAGHTAVLLEFYDEALDAFTACIDSEPDDATNYIFRGDAYFHLDNRAAALEDFARGIALDESNAWAYSMRGNAYFYWRDFDEAIEDFSTAIMLDDDDADSYHDRGLAYLETERYLEAIDDFTASIERNPDDSIAFYNRGLSYDHLNRYTPALEDYTHSIELDPSYADAFAARGRLNFNKGLRDAGMEDVQSAVALPADNRYSRFNRGMAFVRLEDYESAVADFTFAIEDYPYDPDYFAERGDAYWELGKHDQAVADYQEYKRLTGRLRNYMAGRVDSSSDTSIGWELIVILIGGAAAIVYIRFRYFISRHLFKT
jgi:tetratricopeptide (TPR) repeat protein